MSHQDGFNQTAFLQENKRLVLWLLCLETSKHLFYEQKKVMLRKITCSVLATNRHSSDSLPSVRCDLKLNH